MARYTPKSRRKPKNQAEWELEGAEAILDLVNERLVVPPHELESRISGTGWKDFWTVQPIQLSGSRRRLLTEELICIDTSSHTPRVTTIRIPFPEGRKREIERLRGRVRKKYRKYLSWAGDHPLCGKQAEHVVLDSLFEGQSRAGLYVPPQTAGEVRGVENNLLPGEQTLDALAYILKLPEVHADVPMLVEVKNVHAWLYPSARELWELLVKCAHLAEKEPILPLLVCVRAAFPTTQMGKDVGFFVCQLRNQVFSDRIDRHDFEEIRNEFGLLIEQHDGPHAMMMTFLKKTLRAPPASPPEEDIEWYRRQADRFQVLAPVVLAHDALASTIQGEARAKVFASFKYQASRVFEWPSVGLY